jgi:hypothetical protein
MVLLGVLAVRSGSTLDIDQTTGMPAGVALAPTWLKPEFRKGWTV